jgi:glycolate oxidase FAD binding subunit
VSATVARAIPTDAAECARVLAEATRERRTVRIIGSGTKSYVGDVAATDLEVGTSRLAGVIDHEPADLTVTVGAGMRIADLAKVLERAGQFLPLDPPHADDATIGGVIAANSNGFWRARYGAVRDLLIGTRTALADGTVALAGGRVVKNVAGYDLDKLLVGSFGTLGVIVEATLKVLPVPVASDGLVARFARSTDAFAAANAVVRGAPPDARASGARDRRRACSRLASAGRGGRLRRYRRASRIAGRPRRGRGERSRARAHRGR